MGHLVEAIKKLEQRRVIEEAAPAPPAPAKSTRKRSRRIDPPHATAAVPSATVPRAARRRACKPASKVEPAAAPPPTAIEAAAAEEAWKASVPAEAERATPDVAPTGAPLPGAARVGTAIEPIGQAAAVPAEPCLSEQLPIDVACSGEPRAECAPLVEPAEVANPSPAAIPATIALAAHEAAPAARASAGFPIATKSPRPLRLVIEDDLTAADVTSTVWEIAPPSVPSNYRELAVRLCSSSPDSELVRSVLVVGASVAASEAISFPALAVALAARGSVLWVDPRRRRPVTTPSGADDAPAPGLRELAAGEAGWDEVIHKTTLADVSFVGCGVGPTDRRGEAAMAAGMESLPAGFSLVLVDGGLAEQAAALAAVCQAVGLAVVIGHDRRGEIENALAALDDAGVASPLVIAVG